MHTKLLGLGIIGLLLLLGGCAESDKTEVQRFVESVKRMPPNKKIEDPPKIQPYTPFTYTAQEGKDPFVVSAWASEPDELTIIPDTNQQNTVGCAADVKPDPNRRREDMEKYSLGSLKMMGTLRMANSDELWALVRAPDSVIHRVRKDNYLGNNHGRVTTVSDNKIDIVEIVQEAATEKNKPSCWKERQSSLSIANQQ